MFVLRKPTIWELLGLLLATAAIVVAISMPLWQEQRNLKQLEISHGGSWDPLLCTGSPEKFTITYDGIPRDKMYLSFFVLKNSGARAIDPEDYVEPMRVNSTNPSMFFGIVHASSNEAKWSKSDEGGDVLLLPTLNPSEQVIVTLASEAPDRCLFGGEPGNQWIWSGKLRNGVLKIDQWTDEEFSSWDFLNLQVELRGVFIWIALFCSASFFYLSALAISLKNWRLVKRWVLVIPVFLVSVANGENVAAVAAWGWSSLWPAAKYFLIAHVAALVLLLSPPAVRFVSDRFSKARQKRN